VIVLERDEIGKGASYGNAGCIAPGHPPINRPGRIRQALESLLDPLSPLYVAPRPDPALAKWLWKFSRTCTERHVDAALRTLRGLTRCIPQDGPGPGCGFASACSYPCSRAAPHRIHSS